MKHIIELTLVSAFSLAVTAPALSQPSYNVTNLGTLGGTGSKGYSLNSLGHVVGQSLTSASHNHGYVYKNASLTDLGTLGGSFSEAWGINDTGQIAGLSTDSTNFVTKAFLSNGGGLNDIGTLGGTNARAFGINANGQIVGYSDLAGNNQTHAFLYSGGTMTDLGTLGGTQSYGFGVNSLGQAVGQSSTAGDAAYHAFLYSGGPLVDLGTLPGGNRSAAFAINASGKVVGESNIATGAVHAFLYSSGAMADLGTLGTGSTAFGINTAGQIVGVNRYSFLVRGAFLYMGGQMYDLNQLIPAGSGWVLEEARAINDAGRITGSGTYQGAPRAFLLTPVVTNSPPVANAGPDQTIECAGPSGAVVRLDGSGSTDPDNDPLTFTWTGPFGTLTGPVILPTIPAGTHTVTLTVKDSKDATSTDTVVVTVRDTGAPSLTLSLAPNVLWPPNHNLVEITATLQATDACGGALTFALASITSNEPDNGSGDGDQPNDIQGADFGADDRKFFLRAERSGTGSKRVYTVVYEARDGAGNKATVSGTVVVPKDARR